jgi:hypothetical protein
MCVEGSTVAPPPGPARNRPLTGQHSCRQPVKVIVVKHLQRWRTVGEGPQYLKIVGKVLYRLKDIEAYEEACLIRKVF